MSLPLKWEFPGGKVEVGESPKECLKREIKEELDIIVKVGKALPMSIHAYPKVTIKLIPFICEIESGDIILNEHSDFRWEIKENLLDLDWADADIPIVKNYLNL